MNVDPKFLIVGDQGVLLKFGDSIDFYTNIKVRKLSIAAEREKIYGVIETIPTFNSLFISYNPSQVSIKKLKEKYLNLSEKLHKIQLPSPMLYEIPILYDKESDLKYIADYLKLSEEKIIKIHSGEDYYIYMNGFYGAAYFKLPETLSYLPRKKTPALSVPAGSITFAGGLGTAIKPLDGPTGWWVIGKSPLQQWLPHKVPPILVQAGNFIKYLRIGEKEYREIKKKFMRGTYKGFIKNYPVKF